MHIPDGFLSPATYVTGLAVATPLLALAFKKTKESLNDETLPLISTLSAFCFVVMMFNIPIPGGTSGHAIGTAVLAVLFGPWVAALGVSLVLLIQSLIFADGGITAFGINSVAMGFAAAFSASFAYHILHGRINEKAVLFICGWVAAVTASIVIGVALGLQPIIAHNDAGQPLFFPFDLSVTIPAIVGSHVAIFGLIEGVVTAVVVAFVQKIQQKAIQGGANVA